jgi:hypothetical protein
MAPAVLEHPGARPIRSYLMDTTSVAYVLCRIEDDSSLTPVSEHEDLSVGIRAGKHMVMSRTSTSAMASTRLI